MTHLLIHHLDYRCHVCGGVEVHDSLESALARLEKADEYDPEPSGVIIPAHSFLAYRLIDGENKLVALDTEGRVYDTQSNSKE